MASCDALLLDHWFGNAGTPSNERCARVVWMTVSVTSPITHAMICRKHVSRLAIAVELVNQLGDLPDSLVNDLDIV